MNMLDDLEYCTKFIYDVLKNPHGLLIVTKKDIKHVGYIFYTGSLLLTMHHYLVKTFIKKNNLWNLISGHDSKH